jgi:hypothetical protein
MLLKYFLLLLVFASLSLCSPMKNGKRAILSRGAGLWKNNILPYVINWATYNHNYTIISKIENAMKHMEMQLGGCIKLIPRTYESEYIIIQDGKQGCNSHMGVQKSQPQYVNLEYPGCFPKGTIIHELMHALGFGHEQDRPDRLDWMEIQWDNVKDECKNAFKISFHK